MMMMMCVVWDACRHPRPPPRDRDDVENKIKCDETKPGAWASRGRWDGFLDPCLFFVCIYGKKVDICIFCVVITVSNIRTQTRARCDLNGHDGRPTDAPTTKPEW